MARGTKIIVSSNPKGLFSEGTLTAITPVPGVIMQIDASAGIDDNGKFTFELYNRDAAGDRPQGPLYILLEDELQGGIQTTAYASGAHCFLYTPMPGEEFNLIVANLAGTGDDHTIGDLLSISDTDNGELIATTGETEPFMLLETITDPTADTLAHVIYTGY